VRHIFFAREWKYN